MTPLSGLSSLNLLGATYTFTQGAANYDFDTQNIYSPYTTATHWTDNYSSPAGDHVQITYSWVMGDAQPTQRISGADPYVGSFSADYTGGINSLVWDARTAPSFTQATLYLNGTLLNWQSGAIDTAGVVTDTYGPDSNGKTLVIKGSVRDFTLNTASADVSINGASVGTYAHGASLSIAGWDVAVSAPNRETPFFTVATLWVDGTPYAFSNGYGDANGNRKDVYLSSGGTVSICGNTASSTANVQANHNGEIHTGTGNFQQGGSFTVQGVVISAIAPDTGPPAFWVGDVFYRRTAGTNQYTSFPTAGNSLSLDGTDPTAMRVSGSQAGSPISGTFDPSVGVFLAGLQNGPNPLPACPARADGSQIPSGNVSPFAPAVHLGTEVWNFLGTTTDDGASGSTAAYYGNTRAAVYTTDPAAAPLTPDDHRRLLKIRIDPANSAVGVVTVTDYRTSTSTAGSYLSGLFQTGTTSSLPMPIYSVDPNANDTPWPSNQGPPAGSNAPGSGPATLLVGNQVWRYSGASDGSAHYVGYYDGQQLTLSAPNAGGIRTITVTDPVNGNATGMLSDVNGSTTLSNGQTINSGTPSGTQVQPQNLATVDGDLSVPGSIISLGNLNGDTTTAGATLQFSDSGTQAMFGTALGRSAAQWVWWRVDPANAAGFVPTMVVDSAFGLVLYDPTNSSLASVKLNPAAGSVSELPKLKLTGQTLDEDGSVLTRALGDDRYLRASGANQSLSLGSGINVNIGGSGSTNTVPADAAAIGQNLQAASGQVVVGRNSVADSDEIFIVGAGASATETKNALSVSTSGNTSVMGTLTVTGAATLSSAAISGTLTVGGQSVLTQNAADTRYIQSSQVGGGGNSAILTQDAADTRYQQKGQIQRVAPAGDIDMGDFQATPPGVTAPTAP